MSQALRDGSRPCASQHCVSLATGRSLTMHIHRDVAHDASTAKQNQRSSAQGNCSAKSRVAYVAS